MKFLVVFAIAAVIGVAASSEVEILDQNEEPIERIAEQVCWHSAIITKQISKISTIPKLAEYWASLPAEHKLAPCSRFLKSTQDLANLVSVSNDNVCSEDKISAIQQFHRGYILKGSQRTGKTSKVLATFFFHYVHSITEICGAETADFLSEMSSLPKEDTTQVDKLLANISEKTGLSSSSKLQYPDIFLPWSLVDMLPMRNNDKVEKYLFEGEKRVVVATKNPKPLLKMQELCNTLLKPYYSKSLLASIKLIDMGFYPLNVTILDQLNNNKQARRFYELTRMCETMTPVRVVQQSQAAESEPVFLSRQDVEQLALGAHQSEPEVEAQPCMRCSMSEMDTLKSVIGSGAAIVANSVKNDINSRKGAVSRLLKILFMNGKASIVAKLNSMFGKDAPAKIEAPSEEELKIFEVYDEDESQTKLGRSKRGIVDVFQTIVQILALVFVIIAYIIWGYIQLFILVPMSVIVMIFIYIGRGLEKLFGW